MSTSEKDKFNDPSSKIFNVPFDYLQLISFSGEPVTGKLYLRNESDNSLIFRVLIPKTPRLKVYPKFGVIQSLTILTVYVTVTPSNLITDFDFFKRNYQVLIQTLQRQVTNKNEIKEIFRESRNLNAAVKFWQQNFIPSKRFPHPNQSENTQESHLKLVRRFISSAEVFSKKPTSGLNDSKETDDAPIQRLRTKRNAKYQAYRNRFQVNLAPFGKSKRPNKYAPSRDKKMKSYSDESKSTTNDKKVIKQTSKPQENLDIDIEKIKSESIKSDTKSEKDVSTTILPDDSSRKILPDDSSRKMYIEDYSIKVDDIPRKTQVDDASKKARALAYFLNTPVEKIQNEEGNTKKLDDVSPKKTDESSKKTNRKKKKNKRSDSKGSIDSVEISRKTSQKTYNTKNKFVQKEEDSAGKSGTRRHSKNHRSSQIVSRKSIAKDSEIQDRLISRRASLSAMSSRASQRSFSLHRVQRTSSYNMRNVSKKLEEQKFKLNYLNEIKAKQERYQKSKKTSGWKYKPYDAVKRSEKRRSEDKKDRDVSSSKTMDSEMERPSERSLLASRKNLDPYRIERQYSWDRADLDLNDIVKMRSDSDTIKSTQNSQNRKILKSTMSISTLESDDPDKPRGTRAKKAMLRLEKKFTGSINSKTLSLELKEIMNKGTPSYEEPILHTKKSKTEPVYIKKVNSEKAAMQDPYENHYVSDFFDRTSPEVKFSLLRHQDIKSMKTKKIVKGDEESVLISKISIEKHPPLKPRFSEVLMELFTNRNKMQINQYDKFRRLSDNKIKYEVKNKGYLRDRRLEFIARLGIYTYMRRAMDELEDESPIKFNNVTKLSCSGQIPNSNENFQSNNAESETSGLSSADDSEKRLSWMRIENNIMLTNHEILIKGYNFLMKNLHSNPYATNPITLSRDYEYSPPGISFNPNLIKCSVDECDIFKADCGYLFQNPTIKGFVSSGNVKQWNGYTVKPKAKSKNSPKSNPDSIKSGKSTKSTKSQEGIRSS